jgi:hypothetical protein
VERHLDDPDLTARLDAMTQLTGAETRALTNAVTPPPDLHERLVERVSRRVEGEILTALIDLYGLGWHTASAVFDPEDRDHGKG